MNFIEIVKEKLNITLTENNDKAYKTSNSYCLDFFALSGGMRFNQENALYLYLNAYNEDPITALKLLFYLRDIKNGYGERNLFRYLLYTIAKIDPEKIEKLFPYIKEYGRYDDIFALYNTPLKDVLIKYIKNQLEEDEYNKKNNKPYSLLAKWMPSINTSSKEKVSLARKLAKNLNMTEKEYRKMLSYLRKDSIIENNLREKDYTFNYSTVPGCAFLKYKKAFYRNDEKRLNEFLSSIEKNEDKINTEVLYPYQIIRAIENKENLNLLQAMWNDMLNNDTIKDSKTIVVRDGSGSMTWSKNQSIFPIDISTSLAIFYAQKLTGDFHNKFITFSSIPQLVELPGDNIFQNVKYCYEFDDYTNTDIEKVFNLILDVYKSKDFNKEDALDRIVIISDMEFDQCTNNDLSTFEKFKKDFSDAGFIMPQVIFWNVAARNIHLPVKKNEQGVALVSGASKSIIKMISNNEFKNPLELLEIALNPYKFIEEILK